MAREALVGFPSTRRALAKQQTRRRLIEAARRLVAERGYEAATLRDVASLAGVSTGAVFASFEDKADLFNAVIIDDAAAIATAMRPAQAEAATAGQALLAMLSVAAAIRLEQPSLFMAKMGFCWSSGFVLEQRRRAGERQILDALAGAVRAGVRSGELSATIDAELVAEMAWDSGLAACRRAVFEAWTLERVVAHLAERVELLLDGSRIVAPARRALRG